MISTHLPPLYIGEWLNTPSSDFNAFASGRVVLLHAFQMLCPGCVYHSLPQLKSVAEAYSPEQVSVVGLHSVFEHHAAMSSTSLKAFISEMGITYPIGIDLPGHGAIPQTMAHYQMRGTPSLLIFDASANLRFHHFGRLSDMQLSAMLGQALWCDESAELAISGSTGCSL